MRRILGPVLLVTVLAVGCGRTSVDEERPFVAVSAPETTTTLPATTTTATTVATTTTAPSTTLAPIASTAAPVTELALAADGLGLARFGDASDPTIAALTSALGTPTEDSGWVDASTSPFGVCPGVSVRGVRWGPLRTLFSDTGDGTAPSFFTYVYAASLVAPGEDASASSGVRTATGVGLGSSVAELQAAHPDAAVASDIYGPTFRLGETTLAGTLSDESSEAIVTSLVGGTSCGE